MDNIWCLVFLTHSVDRQLTNRINSFSLHVSLTTGPLSYVLIFVDVLIELA